MSYDDCRELRLQLQVATSCRMILLRQQCLQSHIRNLMQRYLGLRIAQIVATTPPKSAVSYIQTKLFTHQATYIMAGVSAGSELERLKTRAELMDTILADLKTKVAAVKKAAVAEANSKEAERLRNGINHQLSEISKLKKALMLTEVGNGVRQIHMPTKAELNVMMAKLAETSDSGVGGPVSNGDVTTAGDKGAPPAGKGKKENKSKPNEKAGGDQKENSAKSKANEKPSGGKKSKAEKGDTKANNSSSGAGDAADAPVDISRLDMRIGKIVAVDKHPDADSLYVEQVDVGEGRNRTVVSGLVKHVPITAMKDRIAVFMCNLKPAKMRGVLSEGMIMCASSPDKVEILVPPADAAVGDRVTVQEFPGTPDAQLNPKKKIWETLKPDVRTNADRVATYKGGAFKIEGKGIVVAPTLANSQIS